MDKYFEILGLDTNATIEEVKKAYRELSKKYHPDLHEDDEIAKELATEKFRKINEAYEELKKYFETREELVESNPNVLKWQDYIWTLDNNLILYNLIRKELQSTLETELMWYEATYKAYENLENFVFYNKNFVQERIERIFNILVEVCIKNGINIYSGKILSQKYFNRVTKNYQYYYNYCKNFLNNIDRRNQDRQYNLKVKELNDIYRGKNGIINKAMRGTESLVGGMQDNQEKQNLYSDPTTLKNLKNSFKESIFECLEVVVELLGIQTNFDKMLSESIVENIQKYPKNQLSERLMEALRNNPYDLKIYLLMLVSFGDRNGEIEKISNYFGIEIRNFKYESLKEYIEKFKQSDLENLDYHLENLKSEITRLGLKLEDYSDLIKKETKIKKNKAINEYIEKFKQSDLENLDYHLENLKSEIIKLGLNLKNYTDMIEETTRAKKDQKASECIKNFKNLLKKDKVRAEEELKAEMSRFGLKLEEYIDIKKEYERFDKKIKDKKSLKILVMVISVFLCTLLTFKLDIPKNFQRYQTVKKYYLNEKRVLENEDHSYTLEYYSSGRVKFISDGYTELELEDKSTLEEIKIKLDGLEIELDKGRYINTLIDYWNQIVAQIIAEKLNKNITNFEKEEIKKLEKRVIKIFIKLQKEVDEYDPYEE